MYNIFLGPKLCFGSEEKQQNLKNDFENINSLLQKKAVLSFRGKLFQSDKKQTFITIRKVKSNF